MIRLLPTLSILCGLIACSGENGERPLAIDIIGERPDLESANPTSAAGPALEAIAQGLVALDAEGEIEPALAKRWTVLDDGRTYIFRLRDLTWQDGTALTAGQVARQLREASEPGSRNPLAPMLADIEEINAIAPEIVEIVLRRPRADLLSVLAQPDLAIRIGGEGFGAFQLDSKQASGDTVELVPYRPPPDGDDEAASAPASPELQASIALSFQTGSRAVGRFRLGQTDLVLGGDWTSLPYAQAIDPPDAQLLFDPVEGLFGLAIVEHSGFLAEARNRILLSQALDRQQLVALLGIPEAQAVSAIIDPRDDSAAHSPIPFRASNPIGERRRFARSAVDRWRNSNGAMEPLRIALPDAPGSRIIYAFLRTNWAAVGIDTERVAWAEDADLRLIDRVAVTDRAYWYLQEFRCERSTPCTDDYEKALAAIEQATSARVRAIRIAEAAAELEAMGPFIPLLRPIRWSLVSSRITGFVPNRYASHPLATLTVPSG